MSSESVLSISQNFVLVVDNLGDTEILNLSYDVNWIDLSVMLQIKFEYEDKPQCTYTDEDDDFVCLDSQEAYEEALKVCRENSDVLHIQVRKSGVPIMRLTTRQPVSVHDEDKRSAPPSRDHVEMARNAVGSTLGWASKAVKSAFNDFGRGIKSNQDIPMQPVPDRLTPDEAMADNENEGVASTSECPQDERIFHEVDLQSETMVKEPLDSYMKEISVSTASISGSDVSEVKMPIGSTFQQSSSHTVEESKDTAPGNDVMLNKFKEEVREAISQQFSAFRSEINTSIVQNLGNKRSITSSEDDDASPSTSSPGDGPRSPRRIKVEIKQLKKEMKEAKQIKKLRKQSEREKITSPTHNTEKRARKYAASFICENLLDGSCVQIGQQFVKYWVLKNDGAATWDHMIELRLIEEQPAYVESAVDPVSQSTLGSESGNELDRLWGPDRCGVPMPIVETSGTAVIAVSYVAPNFPCKYTSQWRLSHNGRPFGPRIWCSVDVRTAVSIPEPDIQSMSLTESERELSAVMKDQIPQRSTSNDNALERICDGDDLSSMLSFEMTGVGDFNKLHSSDLTEFKHSFAYTGPTSIRSEPKPTEPETVKETDDMKMSDQVEPYEVMEVKEQSCSEEDNKESASHEEVVSDIESLEEINQEDEETSEKVTEEKEDTGDGENAEQEGEDTSDDLDETGSDVMSDFEVIPLPECFDTTRPLSGGEKSLENEENISSLQSVSTVVEDRTTDVESPKGSIVTHGDATAKETAEHDSLDATDCIPFETGTEFKVSVSEPVVVSDHSPVASLSNQSSSYRSNSPSVAPRPRAIPQSVLEQDKSTELGSNPGVAAKKPIPVPQSVLNVNEPCPVVDYSSGYPTPFQMTAGSHDEGWIQQPIPLPRGVLDADKPWTRSEQSTSNLPLPHPRNILSTSRSSGTQRPWDASSSLEPSIDSPPPPPPPVDVSDDGDSPQIYYPPDGEDSDEFILAPVVAAYPESPSQILLPPEAPSFPHGSNDPRTVNASDGATPIEQLIDMGFLDIDLNYDLLKEFENDLNRVVHALVYNDAASIQRIRDRRPRRDGTYIA